MNEKQKELMKNVVIKLFNDNNFIEFFFSIHFPSRAESSCILSDLLKIIPQYQNLDIVDNILHCSNFKQYYVITNTQKVKNIISYFVGDVKDKVSQEKIYNIIMTFEGKERIIALRLLYKYVVSPENIVYLKNFLKNNYSLVGSEDIFDFVFNDWLEISEKYSLEIMQKAIKFYKEQQNSSVRSYPDPLHTQLELIYILYITDKISDIESLREIIDASDFLQFFIEPSNFDYHKIDFSNYMWQNIARRPKFMEIILTHKDDIIPKLKQRVEINQATEFERKILYGYLLDKNELL